MSSERLRRILSGCRKAGIIADIGVDHGLLCAELVRSKKAEKAIAVSYTHL